jgi:hypothetical protein
MALTLAMPAVGAIAGELSSCASRNRRRDGSINRMMLFCDRADPEQDRAVPRFAAAAAAGLAPPRRGLYLSNRHGRLIGGGSFAGSASSISSNIKTASEGGPDPGSFGRSSRRLFPGCSYSGLQVSQIAKSPQREITTKLTAATENCCQEVGREIKPKYWG